MKQYKHVKIIDSELQRKYFTRHGMHMNLAGKELIAQRIMEHIKEHLTKRETSTITLRWKQEMDKRTASTREHDPGTSTDVSTAYIQENQTSYLNNNNSKDTTDTNSVIGCSVGKATLPKRDKKCLKEKNGDFLMVLETSKKGKKPNNLTIYHQNVRSLNKKKDELNICYRKIRVDHISYA